MPFRTETTWELFGYEFEIRVRKVQRFSVREVQDMMLPTPKTPHRHRSTSRTSKHTSVDGIGENNG